MVTAQRESKVKGQVAAARMALTEAQNSEARLMKELREGLVGAASGI